MVEIFVSYTFSLRSFRKERLSRTSIKLWPTNWQFRSKYHFEIKFNSKLFMSLIQKISKIFSQKIKEKLGLTEVLLKICHDYSQAPPGGIGNVPPPRNVKNCCRKMMLFPKAVYLATTFPKIVKNSTFLLNFYQNFSKISKNFPTCAFRPNAPKINAWLVKFIEKYAKIMDFLQFS